MTEPTATPKICLPWTEATGPSEDCHYDHLTAQTPFGRFLLTWKGWKDQPDYGFDETPWGEVEYHGWDTIDEAKAWAETQMGDRIFMLIPTPELERENARLREALKEQKELAWMLADNKKPSRVRFMKAHHASNLLLTLPSP